MTAALLIVLGWIFHIAWWVGGIALGFLIRHLLPDLGRFANYALHKLGSFLVNRFSGVAKSATLGVETHAASLASMASTEAHYLLTAAINGLVYEIKRLKPDLPHLVGGMPVDPKPTVKTIGD